MTVPLARFLHIESASGMLLVLATAVALAAANTSLAEPYSRFWSQTLRIGVAHFELAYPLWYWINDALMAVFFFVIGLEIKRELVLGELRGRDKVVLPAAAALGGAIVPILIFLGLAGGGEEARGWAIPMATDIAFVVGCLALLGDRVPKGLKILMLSLAIVDDLIAVVVIAIFFTASIKFIWLGGAGLGLIAVVGMRRIGVRSIPVYFLVGIITWLCTLKSGVHPTGAGVLLGLLTPTRPWIDRERLLSVLRSAVPKIEEKPQAIVTEEHVAAHESLRFALAEATSPLERLESALHPWVAFLVMPLFALANAGVAVDASRMMHPASVAVAAGLFLGKPLGITAASWIVLKLGWAHRPAGVTWFHLIAGSSLAGIGFTMALFVASLALADEALAAAKSGVLLGSGASIIVGMVLLFWAIRRPESGSSG